MMNDNEWIKIERLDYILQHFKPLIFHPDDPQYKRFWIQMRKRCVEGCWVEQFGKMRYVPGRLGFYGTFFRFVIWTDEGERLDNQIPDIRDLEWHRAYYDLEADGFSGWANDDQYTSDKLIFDIKKSDNKLSIADNRLLNLYTKSGNFKEYIPPRENIFMLHDRENLGRPLYYNEKKNHLELGVRGGGKSYYRAGANVQYNIAFNASKSYNPDEPIQTKAFIEICSPGGGKGKELLEKVRDSNEALKDPRNKELGVIEIINDKGKKEISPCPFYRLMKGHISAGNKENPWTNAYTKKSSTGEWDSGGFGDVVFNTSNSPNQKDAAVKSAGGRRTEVIYEEIGGYHPGLLLDTWGNNEGLVSEAGYKNATQKGIGTAGSMENIRDAQKIMLSPKEYRCLEFEYLPGVKTGFFLPVYMVDTRFKDENGNTDVKAAKEHHEAKIKKMMDEGNPADVILNYKMNSPMEIDDMWITAGGKTMPIDEAKNRRKILQQNKAYIKMSTPINLYWDSLTDSGVNYDLNSQAEPFYRFPYTGKKNIEGAFEMFIHPDKLRINGVIPKDAVFTFVDPYVADEWDKGGSLGAAYWIVNPKYIPNGLPGYKIAAKYVGKPKAGVNRFCEIVCMGYAFYGNGEGTVWYEANRKNDLFRAMFIKNNRLMGLCSRPQFVQGSHIFLKKTNHTGYLVGANKDHLWTALAGILKEEVTLTIDDEEVTRKVIELLDDLFIIEQIIEADNGVNVDAVSALQGLSLALGESEQISKLQGDSLGHLSGLVKFTSQLSKIIG